MKRHLLVTLPIIMCVSVACQVFRPEPKPTAESALASATATERPEATPTLAPTLPSATPTDTSTPTPTLTPTRAPSETPTPRPTDTQAPTPSRSPTPQATVTVTPAPLPTASPGPAGPRVVYFRSNVDEADPGDTITLEWMTTGAITVTLWHLMPSGQFGSFWTVEDSGTFDYDIGPGERNQTRFALSVADEMGTVEMATLSINLRCPDTWFFANPPDICPATAAIVSSGAEERFEHGLMLWVQGEDRIYILFDDGSSPKWNAYQDHWEPGLPDRDPILTPPAGLYQPVRGFGLLWREETGLRDRLGWATDQEMAYSTAVQRTSYSRYNETYIRARDGQVWRLMAERSGWEKIPG